MVTESETLESAAWHLAEINVARALEPLESPRLADFVADLDRINALAEAAPGFVWRLKDESGNATDIPTGDDPLLIVNLSVWKSRETLFDFVYRSSHTPVMARRREWFEKPARPPMALWWLPAGELPSLATAMEKLDLIARLGPTPDAFSFKLHFPPPDAAPMVAMAGEQPPCP